MSPEVAADAAEPLGVVTLDAVLSEAAVLASAPSMVVAPSNVLSACCVAVKETVTELSLCPEFTTVEPPEVAATAAEPPEVSVVSTCDSLSLPVTTMEAVCELLPCFELATEANNEPSFAHVTAMEAAFEHLYHSEPAMVADCELPVCLVSTYESVFELSVMPVSVTELPAPVSVYAPDFELSVGPVPAKVFDYELSVGPVPVTEMSVSPVSLNESDFTFTFNHLADAFIQSDVQMRRTIEAIRPSREQQYTSAMTSLS